MRAHPAALPAQLLLLLLATAGMAAALSPPVYNPTLAVMQLTPQPLAAGKQVAGGSFRLTSPPSCAPAPSAAAKAPSAAAAGAAKAASTPPPPACAPTGFELSNAPDFAGRTNSAVFVPSPSAVMLDPFAPTQEVELGKVHLRNGGFMQPQDVGMPQVPVSARLNVSTKGSGKPAAIVALTFTVSWSLGSPAPPNNAGLFVLSTRATPAPAANFSAPLMVGVPDLGMSLRVAGFVADTSKGKEAAVLGDWGQPAPAAGKPGPRVSVAQGASPQVVRLLGTITRTTAL